MRTALLARSIRPALSLVRGSHDRMSQAEPVEIYGDDEGCVFAWFPNTDVGPILPPDVSIFRIPSRVGLPLLHRLPPPEPLIALNKTDELPWTITEIGYTVRPKQWAVTAIGKTFRWAVSLYCAFDERAGDWVLVGEHQVHLERYYEWLAEAGEPWDAA